MTLSTSRTVPNHTRYDSAAELENVYLGHVVDHNTLHEAFNAGEVGGVAAEFVVGAEGGNVINVGVQLNNAAGAPITAPAVVEVFLSDDIDGLGLSAGAPSASTAIGTDGAIIVTHVADLAFLAQSDADGALDFDINEVGVATWYLVVVLASGGMAVSPAITFA